jgi:hypothetical protein
VLVALLPLAAFADGFGEPPPYDDPCVVPPPSQSVFKASVIGMDPEAAWQMHVVLRDARCGDVPDPLFRIMGMTESEILRSAFNGHQVPKPMVLPSSMPVPGTLILLLTAVGALALAQRSRARSA